MNKQIVYDNDSKRKGGKQTVELLKIEELSDRLKVSTATIYRLMKKGLPVVKIANSTRYDFEEVVEWLKKEDSK